jgi:cysteine-S-conjugate beta-lyase
VHSSIDLTVPPLHVLRQRRSEKWSVHDPDVLSATIAEMDFPLAEPVADALSAAIARSDVGYAPPSPTRLRHCFATFAARRLGWTVDAEQVVLIPDVMIGLIELCRAVTSPGDAIAFASPAYPPFFTELPQTGVRLVQIDLGADGTLDLAGLDSAIAGGIRALILANPHNPTGRVPSHGELAAVADRCAEHDVWVLADEIHAPLTLPGVTHTPWLEVSDAARERGIALTSASKAFNLAGLKAALMVTAGGRARELVCAMPTSHDHCGLLGVIAAEAAFEHGDAWLDAVIDQLDANRSLLARTLIRELPKITWTPPQATYLAWLDCTGLGLGDEPAEAFLRNGRVALGRGLDYGPRGARHVRLNFATSPEHLTEIVARMTAGLSSSSC